MSLSTNVSLSTCPGAEQSRMEMYHAVDKGNGICFVAQIVDITLHGVLIPTLTFISSPLVSAISILSGGVFHSANLMFCHGETLKDAFWDKSEGATWARSIRLASFALSFFSYSVPIRPAEKTAALIAEAVRSDGVAVASSGASGSMLCLKAATSLAQLFGYNWEISSSAEREELRNMNHFLSKIPMMDEKSVREGFADFKLFDIHSKTVCNPLLYAVDRPLFLSELQRMGAYPNPVDENGRGPIHLAVISRKEKSLSLLLKDKEALIDLKDLQGWTPLCHAVLNEEISLVRQLVAVGADVNALKGRNHFVHQAYLKGSMELFEILTLNAGFDVDAKGENGSTILFYAVAAGKKEWISRLMEKGADADILNYDGVSPRMLAKRLGQSYFKD